MTVAFHLDADDLDAIPFDPERAGRIAREARAAREALVARYLGTPSPDLVMVACADEAQIADGSPI